jgi:signal transduction histidine kinase
MSPGQLSLLPGRGSIGFHSPPAPSVRVNIDLPAEHRALLAVATADDIHSGMTAVTRILLDICGAGRVEWREAGRPAARVVAGSGRGGRLAHRLSLGPAGAIVIIGGRRDPRADSVVAAVLPVIRRRYAEARLADTALELARRNEALEDFAALVAHELKAPLHAALAADDPSRWVQHAIDLVDALLEAAHEPAPVGLALPAVCLDQAVRDLGAVDVEVTACLPSTLPLPHTALRVILRNLIGNAVAAGARAVRVSATRSPGTWLLVVQDDGTGLSDHRQGAGSGLGLRLCRRIAHRYGGSLGLEPVPSGGTQARLQLKAAV